MATLMSIVKFLDELLMPEKFKDYCPNGLQVEGRPLVQKVITGVTASRALIDEAIAREADMLLVHHGFFWKGEQAPIVGLKKERLQRLLKHDISLVGYHLPLDVHPEFGNNVQLAKQLGFTIDSGMEPNNPLSIGLKGSLPVAMSAEELSAHIERHLKRAPLHISSSDKRSQLIKQIAWCTGAAQGFIDQAVSLGVDAYLSGEISEQTVHIAREGNVDFFAAGHHATERYGVKALGEYLAQSMSIKVEFIDIPNPV